tara:strand:- start:714 stop:914 length:201 start_codon:yes stop_codon:yes gene_type:complete
MLIELIVFTTTALIFGGIMYLWFEWQEMRGKSLNKKLSKRLKELTEAEVMKDLESGVDEFIKRKKK